MPKEHRSGKKDSRKRKSSRQDDIIPKETPSSASARQNRNAISHQELENLQIMGPNLRKRSRRSHEGGEIVEEGTLLPQDKPIISPEGIVNFSLAAVHSHLICGLCSGYYRDPYTITNCMHTFCKSCLFYSVACGCHECPECQVFLGNDPCKVSTLDRNLKELIDKVIFPSIVEEEKHQEEAFYASCGIPIKPEYAADSQKNSGDSSTGNTKRSKARAAKKQAPPTKKAEEEAPVDEIELTVLPEENGEATTTLPKLDCPCLRVSGKFRMSHLKKFITRRLGGSHGAAQPNLDILCHGVSLGDEISLSFVQRLLWNSDESDLVLTYRVATHGG